MSDLNERTAETRGPLAGFRVLDITSGIAGPYCTRLLARYGCEVIKVERPGTGDSARRLGPFPNGIADPERSGMFAFLNIGKRGITLDVTSKRGQPLLDQLIARADLVVTSLRPTTSTSANLLRERIADVNPATSMVAISSFGQDGPYRDYRATETILYGLGGPMHVTGHVHREPVRLGPRVVEFQGGAVAAFASSLALFSLASTGRGRFYDLSLLETQLASHDRQASFLMAAQFTGETFPRLDPSITTDRVWPCADGYIDVGYNSVPFDRVLAAIGHPELLEDPLFVDADARQTMESQAVFTGLFLEWMVQRTMLEAWTTFQEFDIPSGPVYTAREILADPHFGVRGIWETMAVGDVTTRVPRDMAWPNRSSDSLLPAPRLGEHNAAVLGEELGIPDEELVQLAAEGVI